MRQDAFHELYQPPVSGLTVESGASSQSGAEAAAQVRHKHTATVLALWAEPRTLNEIAALAGLPLASVCSIKASIENSLTWDSYVVVTRPDGRTTKRSRWRTR